jgi:hypothetical protein
MLGSAPAPEVSAKLAHSGALIDHLSTVDLPMLTIDEEVHGATPPEVSTLILTVH